MGFVVKTAKTLRNHWKKSTFAAVALLYGSQYAKERFETQELMRVYCEKAAKLGEAPIRVEADPRTVTVILNPNANRRKAGDEFEKYCAPLLHLAGICVNVVKTESEGHARSLIGDLNGTDAVVVAGGDGTVSEVITGLLRRTQENTEGLIPIGVLPLGKTNSVARVLFPCGGYLEKVRSLADATMAVVEEVVQPIDVLKVEVLESENKPIYAVSGIKWGAYRDAETKKDSYWLYGKFRNYVTYLFNGFRSNLTWNCAAELNYTPPCTGCSNCAQATQRPKKWFQRFVKDQKPTFSNITNPECRTIYQRDISTVDFNLTVDGEKVPKLVVNVGPQSVDYFDFVKEGWKSEKGQKRTVSEIIEARSMEIQPKLAKNEEKFFSIDNENYELKPVRVTLLPKLINVFCKKENL
ncbi:acylglycerol kinase, mitochondrial [Tribolium madens]|uniref:acylglycerol kinase, mitochondrial n=1 Tax=Tribolium madens TaxID=41895 RepID=UPI001CF7381A|nr:acylglycerol kinase, mitochondrial [Tribolium madens]